MSADSPESDGKQVGLVLVAIASGICAVLHAVYPARFDEKTALFLGIAIIAQVIHQITKFKGFGVEIEKRVAELQEECNVVGQAMESLEKAVGPGSKSAAVAGFDLPVAKMALQTEKPALNPDDPNKGQFGGKPENNGRKVEAKISPTGGERSSCCSVSVKVSSTDESKPLKGEVKIFLHPTFGRWSKYPLEVRGGVAEDDFESYGAFTIGVEADGGKTKLELDLMDVPGGTKRFYQS